MVWQPSRRIWAGEDLEIDEKELESDAMEGVEGTGEAQPAAGSSKATAGAGAAATAAKSRGSTVSRSEGEVDE
jgi:histone-binding protein RBBP4